MLRSLPGRAHRRASAAFVVSAPRRRATCRPRRGSARSRTCQKLALRQPCVSTNQNQIHIDAVQGTTWGVKGETPVVEVPGKRQTISAASAVNSKGGFWFATYQGGMCAELFVAMLKLIMHGRRKPLYLILDSLPA